MSWAASMPYPFLLPESFQPVSSSEQYEGKGKTQWQVYLGPCRGRNRFWNQETGMIAVGYPFQKLDPNTGNTL